jgi:hypothetical protein
MRIERLSYDNRRTQGAARREWYRQHSPAHLRAAAELTERALAARDRGAPPCVVVLGAGACTEVPLERISRACERVVLVDVDAPGMEQARQELPLRLRERVSLVEADLTGGVSRELAALLRAQPWPDLARLSPESALDAAASCLDQVSVPDPPRIAALEPSSFGLVISALVMTQLFSLPLLDALDMLAIVAPGEAPEGYPGYAVAARSLRQRVALAHLGLIAQLVHPAGAGLLLTDVTGYLLPQSRGPHARSAREILPLLPPEVLRLPEELQERFVLQGPAREWEWLVTSPSPTSPGRTYDVAGYVLRLP